MREATAMRREAASSAVKCGRRQMPISLPGEQVCSQRSARRAVDWPCSRQKRWEMNEDTVAEIAMDSDKALSMERR
jgi:hypothetical protein